MRKSKPCVVIDTNVLVSSLLSQDGLPRKVVYKALKGNITNIISEEICKEVLTVLSRPCFAYLPRNEFVKTLKEASDVVKQFEIITDCRDPDDNKFLECALAGKAEVIITGDKDLLVLNPWRDIKILSPRTFLERYKRK